MVLEEIATDAKYKEKMNIHQYIFNLIKKLLVITMKSLVEEVVDIHAQNLHSYLTMNCEKNTVLGPVVPNPSKIKDNYFRNLYVKCNDLDEAKEIRKKAYEFIRNKDTRRELMVIFDIDR